MSLPACREPGCEVVPFMGDDWCSKHRPPYIGDVLEAEMRLVKLEPMAIERAAELFELLSDSLEPTGSRAELRQALLLALNLEAELKLADTENEGNEPVLDAAAQLLWALENVSDELDDLRENEPHWEQVQVRREKLMQAFGDARREWDRVVGEENDTNERNER